MIQTIAQLSTPIAVLSFIPALITAFLILKEYKVSSMRFSSYYKMLLFQVLLHSLFLFGALFYYSFKTPFIVHSFAMLPLYALLLFRLYHLKWQKGLNLTVKKAILADEKDMENKKKQAQLFKHLRVKINRKSQWH